MAEEANAATGLEDSLKGFDVTGETGGSFEDVIKELEAPPQEVEDPKEPPKEEEKAPPKEEKTPPKEEAKEEAEEKKDDPKAEDDEFFKEFTDDEEEKPSGGEDEDATPESLSKAGKEDWERLRTTKAELKTTLREREAELAELRKQVADLPELRKKAEFAEEAERKLALTNVEATQEYQDTVSRPLKEVEAIALQIAKSNEVSADKLFDALAEPDPGERRRLLKDITEDMDAVDRDDVFKMARDTQTLLSKQDQLRSKAKEAAKETNAMAEKRTAEEQRKAKLEYEEEVARVVPELKKRIPFEELEKGESASAYFESISKKAAEADFEGLSAGQKGYYVASGLMVPRMTKQLRAAQEKISTLEARIKDLNGKEPRVGDEGGVTETSDDFGGDVEAAVAAAVGGKTQQSIVELLNPFMD